MIKMDIHICVEKCNIYKNYFRNIKYYDDEDKWFLMPDSFLRGIEDRPPCYCIEIEKPSFLLKRSKKKEIHLDSDYIENTLWKIKMKSCDNCPYFAEHIISDANHECKVNQWNDYMKMRKDLKNQI